jgi:hypothetical protein
MDSVMRAGAVCGLGGRLVQGSGAPIGWCPVRGMLHVYGGGGTVLWHGRPHGSLQELGANSAATPSPVQETDLEWGVELWVWLLWGISVAGVTACHKVPPCVLYELRERWAAGRRGNIT